MTSISLQIHNHKTVMPLLLATCYITQHLHKSSMNRYNHRLSYCTTSYTWVHTRWSAHRRGHKWKPWIKVSNTDNWQHRLLLGSLWWSDLTWCLQAPCSLQFHVCIRPTLEFLQFYLIHAFVPVGAKLQEVLRHLLPFVMGALMNDWKIDDSCSSLIYISTSSYINKSSVYVWNTFSHMTQTTYECE
jgi:hypothetical protein